MSLLQSRSKRFAAFVPNGESARHVAHTHQRFDARIPVVVGARASALPVGDAGPDGVTLRVRGAFTLGGVDARLTFRRHPPGEPGAGPGVDSDAPLLPPGERIPIPEHLVHSHCGGDPFVWIQFFDSGLHPLASEVCLGRCHEAPRHAECVFRVPASATVWLTAREYSDQHGPVLDYRAELNLLAGIRMRILFADDCDRYGGPLEAREAADVDVLAPGTCTASQTSQIAADAGGTTWITLGFRERNGTRVADEINVGRCVRFV